MNKIEKRQLIQEILQFLRDETSQPDLPLHLIFFNPVSLRLTEIGHTLLGNFFENHSLDFEKITPGELIILSRYLNTPYCISQSKKKFSTYANEGSVILKLIGNVNEWIVSIDEKD